MNTVSSWKKYPTLFSLYIAQSIPMSFFSTVMPVIMRQEDFSLSSIGMLQLVKLPWIAKMFWAPLVDNNSKNTNDLKRWIILSEIFYAVIITSIAFLQIKTDFTLIIALMVVAFTASATQDIATDAFAIKVLKKEERPLGNTIQAGGSFVGSLFGTGVMIFAYSYFGWMVFLFMLAAFVLFALIPLKFYKKNHPIEKPEGYKVNFKEYIGFFKEPAIKRRIPILILYYTPFIGLLSMLKPYLVDLGYSLTEIGFMSGIVGIAAAVVSTMIGGLILKQLGRKAGLMFVPILSIIAALFLWYISLEIPTELQVYIGICLVWAAYGSSAVMIYTSSMDVVRPGAEGTDFTLQIVIPHLTSIIVAVASGKIADALGYSSLFGIEIIFGALALLSVMLFYRKGK